MQVCKVVGLNLSPLHAGIQGTKRPQLIGTVKIFNL
jgi:hypothetical protein